jgi:hypothetical protein
LGQLLATSGYLRKDVKRHYVKGLAVTFAHHEFMIANPSIYLKPDTRAIPPNFQSTASKFKAELDQSIHLLSLTAFLALS